VLEFAGLFSQHWAKIQYTEEDKYLLRDAVIDNIWTVHYAQSLKDWQVIIDKGQATGVANHEATGRTMKAFNFHFVTDIWGDVPYSEALQGDDEDADHRAGLRRPGGRSTPTWRRSWHGGNMFNPGAPGWGART
jgi:hypothetical protein